MSVRIFFNLLLLFSFVTALGKSQQQDFDKAAFYAAIATGKVGDIDAQLNSLKGSSVAEKEAYEGTLLMKKAGLVSKLKDKLNFFKSGRSKLESSISKDKDNTEYRFLRLIIQEHAPGILNYRSDLDDDSKLINKNFKNLSTFLQQQISDYSKKSKVLKTP